MALYLILFFGISMFLVHGSEDIIASGAGDDAICLFAEERSSMVCYPSIPPFFFHANLCGMFPCPIFAINFEIHFSSHNLVSKLFR